jgi:capsular exopolysaccharide synthesis family protein
LSAATAIPEFPDEQKSRSQGGVQINVKRVLDRALRFWYLIFISLAIALTAAHLTNRYSTSIYPVKASIIIRESEENAGAKFLYNNELLSPYRNFYNEIYIMKSYPLLQEVVESLGFNVSLYREGEIKTTEFYSHNFPVEFRGLPTGKSVHGRAFYFTAMSDNTYSLEYITSADDDRKQHPALSFNDSVQVDGFRFFVRKKADISEIKDRTFVVRFNDPLVLAKSYSSRLKINWAMQGASVVDLEVNGPVPQKEIDFLTRFIERYQNYDIEKKNNMASRAIKFLDHQLVVIGDSLNYFEDQVENFKRRNIIIQLQEETNRLYEKLTGFEDQKFQYRLIENYYNYITRLLESDQFDGIFTPASVGITDPVISALVTRLIEARTQLHMSQGSEKRGALKYQDVPGYQANVREIAQIKSNIIETIVNSRKTQQINVAFIDDQINLVEKQLSKLPSTERELVQIQRNYSLRENLYVYLLQKRTEAGLSMASTTSDIVVVNPPMAGGAISPKHSQNYTYGLAAGLLLPILIFVLLELFNNRIQSKEDIEKATDVPVIGGVGHNPAEDRLVVANKPRSAMAESFRALRSNLNYFTGNKERQVFMVTSSIPGEGKSFTALNLASVYALAGKRTILVGADLRKPKLFDELGLLNTVGLSQYLSGMSTLEEVTQASEIDNLYLIAGGPMPPNPSELLLRSAMEDLINTLRQEYDFIIVDTPPLSYVTDAFVLSKYADHTLFVVRQNYTPLQALYALNEFYLTGKLLNISVLFNDLRKSGLGYGYGGGYGYGYGYGYGNYGYGYGGRNKKSNDHGYYHE